MNNEQRDAYDCLDFATVDGEAYILEITDVPDSGELIIPSLSPDGSPVKAIEQSAFENCYELTSITIPEGVEYVGYGAFRACSGLKRVYFPSTVPEIRPLDFWGCASLECISVAEENENYKTVDGNLYTKDGTGLVRYAPGKTDECFRLPEGVCIIGACAFYGAKRLKRVILPEGLSEIGGGAFSGCQSLEAVNIPASVKTIYGDIFEDCQNLTSITVDERNESYSSINGHLYSKDGEVFLRYAPGKADECFKLPEGVKKIVKHAFSHSINPTRVEMPDSVCEIESDAFYFATGLTEIELSKGLKCIASSCFAHCAHLRKVKIPDGVKEIGCSAFSDCIRLGEIILPDSVEIIEKYAFTSCLELKNIHLPKSVKRISLDAFSSCYHLDAIFWGGTEKEWLDTGAEETRTDFSIMCPIFFNNKD